MNLCGRLGVLLLLNRVPTEKSLCFNPCYHCTVMSIERNECHCYRNLSATSSSCTLMVVQGIITLSREQYSELHDNFFRRSRASIVTTAPAAAEPEGKNEIRTFSIAKSTTATNDRSLSERDAVKLSVVANHPAYETNSVNADAPSTGKDNDFPVQNIIRITRLLVCSENGSVTLITVEVM